jgi:hypothetical protein
LITYYTPVGLYLGHLGKGYVPNESGLLMYHVDARPAVTPMYLGIFQFDNTDSIHKMVRFVEAGNTNLIETSISHRFSTTMMYKDLLTPYNVIEPSYRKSATSMPFTITITTMSPSSITFTLSF